MDIVDYKNALKGVGAAFTLQQVKTLHDSNITVIDAVIIWRGMTDKFNELVIGFAK